MDFCILIKNDFEQELASTPFLSCKSFHSPNLDQLKSNQEVIELIKVQLNANYKNPDNINWGRKRWSRNNFEALHSLGEELGYSSYWHGENGEWLFDLIWSIESDGYFEGLALACESEWDRNRKAILADFHKLSICNADIKLFIYQFNKPEENQEVINWCLEYTSPKLLSNGTYVFVGGGNYDENYSFYTLDQKDNNIKAVQF